MGKQLSAAIKQKRGLAVFAEMAAKFNNKFTYHLDTYNGTENKMVITCPVHGDFNQSPYNHNKGAYGCPKCSKAVQNEKVRNCPNNFIKSAKALYGGLYNYSSTDYQRWNVKVKIICPVHGIFHKLPNEFLTGAGCTICANKRTADSKRLDSSEFIKRALAVHGDKYGYDLVEYIDSITPVKIKCLEQNNFFEQSPNNHLSGKGCPHCSVTGFDPLKEAILYYLRVKSGVQVCYKVGITNLTVKARFGSDMKLITVLSENRYDLGGNAQAEEQRILNKFKQYQYTGKPILKSGNTELFTIDILIKDQQ